MTESIPIDELPTKLMHIADCELDAYAEAVVRDAADAIVRLRAALKNIADMEDEDNEWDGVDRFHLARNYARNTLNDGTVPPPRAAEQHGQTEGK